MIINCTKAHVTKRGTHISQVLYMTNTCGYSYINKYSKLQLMRHSMHIIYSPQGYWMF